jgi:hypothetical protein
MANPLEQLKKFKAQKSGSKPETAAEVAASAKIAAAADKNGQSFAKQKAGKTPPKRGMPAFMSKGGY